MAWWRDTFGEKYLDSYVDLLKSRNISREVDFAVDKLGIKRRDFILDLACGTGSHLIELGQRGFQHLFGIDQSALYLQIARTQGNRKRVPLNLIKRDYKSFHLNQRFQAAIMMFTSFGYFDDDRNNIQVLKNVSASLRRKGRFLIDLNNPFETIERAKSIGEIHYRGETMLVENQEHLSNGLRIKKRYSINARTMQWTVNREWTDKGCRSGYEARIYLYTPVVICGHLEKAGLKPCRVWGDFDGSPFTFSSARLIVMAQKT